MKKLCMIIFLGGFISFGFPTIDRSKVRVRIFNGSGIKDQGRKSAMFLRSLGFDVWDIQDTTERFKNTLIMEHTAPDLICAKEIAYAIHYKEKVIKDIDSLLYIDVTVIIGKDYKKFFPANYELLNDVRWVPPEYIDNLWAVEHGAGVTVYFSLYTDRGWTISDGKVTIAYVERHSKQHSYPPYELYYLEDTLYIKTLKVSKEDFYEATLGREPFKEETVIYDFGRIPYSLFKREPKEDGPNYVRIRFYPSDPSGCSNKKYLREKTSVW